MLGVRVPTYVSLNQWYLDNNKTISKCNVEPNETKEIMQEENYDGRGGESLPKT